MTNPAIFSWMRNSTESECLTTRKDGMESVDTMGLISTKESIKTICSTVMGESFGLTAECTPASGETIATKGKEQKWEEMARPEKDGG